ncbi:DUF202 domain-containing protein [Micromonospora sp. NPDC007271]|uniref:DUF202 domain-containing protein n=1 Tax=Micromonospora sp. NPDC007271 TaxID=3154587 RepID=UPI0033FBD459
MTGGASSRWPVPRRPARPVPGQTTGGDGGLQVERTLLAWRRTTAAVLVAGAGGVRLLTPLLGDWAWLVVTPPLGVLVIAAAGRAGALRRRLAGPLRPVPPWPGRLAVVAGLACLTGLAMAAAVLIRIPAG